MPASGLLDRRRGARAHVRREAKRTRQKVCASGKLIRGLDLAVAEGQVSTHTPRWAWRALATPLAGCTHLSVRLVTMRCAERCCITSPEPREQNPSLLDEDPDVNPMHDIVPAMRLLTSRGEGRAGRRRCRVAALRQRFAQGLRGARVSYRGRRR